MMENSLELPNLISIQQADQFLSSSCCKPVLRDFPLIPLGISGKVQLPNMSSPLEVLLQPENLQPIGSFKLRAALCALRAAYQRHQTPPHGFITATAGNMGQAIAFIIRHHPQLLLPSSLASNDHSSFSSSNDHSSSIIESSEHDESLLSFRCICIVPAGSSTSKLAALAKLGAEVVQVSREEWWSVVQSRDGSLLLHQHGIGAEGLVFVHPVAEQAVLVGNATIGWGIAQKAAAVDLVLVPFGGGGLSVGIAAGLQAAAALQATRHEVRVYAVEVEGKCPLWARFQQERGPDGTRAPPLATEDSQLASNWIDGIGSASVLPEMWELASRALDGALVVSADEAAAALLLLLSRNRLMAEGAGAVTVAAALNLHKLLPYDHIISFRRVVCIISGGGLSLSVLSHLIDTYSNQLVDYETLLL